MTYKSRGRSLTEVILVAIFVGFTVGFILVLCIGNYYRAKRAAERQRQQRIARLASNGGNGALDSPKSSSTATSGSSDLGERQHLLAPKLAASSNNNTRNSNQPSRRRNPPEHDLLLQMNEGPQTANLLGV